MEHESFFMGTRVHWESVRDDMEEAGYELPKDDAVAEKIMDRVMVAFEKCLERDTYQWLTDSWNWFVDNELGEIYRIEIETANPELGEFRERTVCMEMTCPDDMWS